MVTVAMKLPADVAAELLAEAERSGTTRSMMGRRLIERGLGLEADQLVPDDPVRRVLRTATSSVQAKRHVRPIPRKGKR